MYFSTMGVSKESISKCLIGNRFHVKLRMIPQKHTETLVLLSVNYK